MESIPEGCGLVVGVFRPGSSTYLDHLALATVQEMSSVCRRSAVMLLDVIVVSGHRWRSLAESAP